MIITHASSCALHNAPASEPGPCDCGATDILERIKTIISYSSNPAVRDLLAECAITIEANRLAIDFARSDLCKGAVIEASMASVAHHRAALLKYGHHLGHCEAMKDGSECTCGFEQARGKE